MKILTRKNCDELLEVIESNFNEIQDISITNDNTTSIVFANTNCKFRIKGVPISLSRKQSIYKNSEISFRLSFFDKEEEYQVYPFKDFSQNLDSVYITGDLDRRLDELLKKVAQKFESSTSIHDILGKKFNA